MLPQKKNLLRRNAWYRQQLLQQVPTSANSQHESDRHPNTRHNATTTNKPQPSAD